MGQILRPPSAVLFLFALVALVPSAETQTRTLVVCREAYIAAGDGGQSLTCYYNTGGSFTTVPAGRYLHITHLTISPFTGGATGDTYVFVYNSGNPSILHKAVTPTPETVNMSFQTPGLVLSPGESLLADNSGDHGVVVTASGYTSDQVEVFSGGWD